MERFYLDDLEIVLDCAGRDDWAKFSFPVWYGLAAEVRREGYQFSFNLRGQLKRLTGNRQVWPYPGEVLRRTDGDDYIYYATDDYQAGYDLLKSYYLPCPDWEGSEVFSERPTEYAHVRQAKEAFDRLVMRVRDLLPGVPAGRLRDFLSRIAVHDREGLAEEAARLHGIIGGSLPVLPPDTIDVDYEVIPLILAAGCHYHCRFCRFKNSAGFSVRNRENVLSQIRELKGFYDVDLVNYNSIVLGENDALAAGEGILTEAALYAWEELNLAHSYHRSDPRLFLFGDIETFLGASDRLFKTLNALPYHTYINLGLESFDQDTLDFLGKPVNVAMITKSFKKLQEINQNYPHITVTGNFVLGDDLSRAHVEKLKTRLSEGVFPRGKGVIYLSPLAGGCQRRTLLRDFREIKLASALPVFLYLAQRL